MDDHIPISNVIDVHLLGFFFHMYPIKVTSWMVFPLHNSKSYYFQISPRSFVS